MKTIKVIITHYHTRRDRMGNVYHRVRVTNPKNAKSFMTDTPDLSNARWVLFDVFGSNMFDVSVSTESARLSSLPDCDIQTESCRLGDLWRKALRSIGYRVAKGVSK